MVIEWCDVDNGKVVEAHELLKKMLDLLYDALQISAAALNVLNRALHFIWYSDLAIEIWDGSSIPDFRLASQKFWAWQIGFGDTYLPPVPLIKDGEIKTLLNSIIQSIDVEATGSENWKFRDTDGSIKYGYEFSPVRKYRIIRDGAKDVMFVTFVVGLATALYKIGPFLKKSANYLISKALGFYKARKLSSQRNEATAYLSEISRDVERDVDLDDQQVEKLSEINNRIGFRVM